MSQLANRTSSVHDPSGPPRSSRRTILEASWVVGVVLFTVARFVVARETLAKYGLNLWMFGAIDLVTAVPYAIGVARVVGAMVDKNGVMARRWVAIAALSFIAPYLYVFASGRDVAYPPTVYVVLAGLLVVFGTNAVVSTVRKVRAAERLRDGAIDLDAPASTPAGGSDQHVLP